MALAEVKALLERVGLTDRLPSLVSNWDTLAEEGFDSVGALRLASADDLVDAGFEPDEAEDLLRALQAGPESRPASPPRAAAPAPPPGQAPKPTQAEPTPLSEPQPEPEPEPHPALPQRGPEPEARGSATGSVGRGSGSHAAASARSVPFRHTAVTCMSPSEFPDKYGAKLRLRSPHARLPGEDGVESLIVITMYNEDADALNHTLNGICDNVLSRTPSFVNL